MLINQQRTELIKTILDDVAIEAQEEEVLHKLLQESISKNPMIDNQNKLSFGDKAADNLAKFAGSWVFIISFFTVLAFWIVINTVFLARPYDVYPFILLNLILSCLAAIQAPIIMMSQNRQEQKDRLRSQNDYRINLKSEIIIEDIHEKLDAIIENQQKIFERLEGLENQNKV